jgi:hypothetical protein
MNAGGSMVLGQKQIFLFLLFSTFVLTTSSGCYQPRENKKSPTDGSKRTASPVTVYKTTCGQCHMAYPPDFLPSGSWLRILKAQKDHFGTPLDLDSSTRSILAQFLTENGAEKAGTRMAYKIMASLEDQTPRRLTEVPYIRKKHRKIPSEVFKRKSIGSFANCSACHPTGADWKFSKRVRIPD